MIRDFLSRLWSGHAPVPTKNSHRTEPRIIPLSEHNIRASTITKAALLVVKRLQEHGFEAFVVGGAIRDLLLGKIPKDFDVATNAKPEEIKSFFRRAFIVGRRFQLVHVLIDNDLIEVSTFRGTQPTSNALKDAHGRILADNTFGTQTEDALRRDFTVNALYYDPEKQEIWDYQGGYADIHRKTLRLIGKPELRYREDPVRMLRAVRLATKLGFRLEPKTEEPIPRLAELIKNVPAARLFDEIQKLLLSGHAVATLRALRAHGLHRGLLPLMDTILEQSCGQRFVDLALENTDQRVLANKPVSAAFLFAVLLWHEVLASFQKKQLDGEVPLLAMHNAMEEVLELQAEKTAIPRRYGSAIKEIWLMQLRFEQRNGKKPLRLLVHPRFRAGFDFLMLRCQSAELPEELGQWWQQLYDTPEEERLDLLIPEERPKRRRRRRRPAAQTDALSFQEGTAEL